MGLVCGKLGNIGAERSLKALTKHNTIVEGEPLSFSLDTFAL